MKIKLVLYQEYTLIADLKKKQDGNSDINLSKGEAIQLIKIVSPCTFQFKAWKTGILFFMFENELEDLIEVKRLTEEGLLDLINASF